MIMSLVWTSVVLVNHTWGQLMGPNCAHKLATVLIYRADKVV
jgi:hypothetical protein